MLNNPDVKAEYDALEKEFTLFDALLNARMQAGLTQAEVADRRFGTRKNEVNSLKPTRNRRKTNNVLIIRSNRAARSSTMRQEHYEHINS